MACKGVDCIEESLIANIDHMYLDPNIGKVNIMELITCLRILLVPLTLVLSPPLLVDVAGQW